MNNIFSLIHILNSPKFSQSRDSREIDPSLLQRVTIWLARCWPTYTLDKYMVVEAKFETMITNDSCFVAVSCLVVFTLLLEAKLPTLFISYFTFFPLSSISFSKMQIMITTTTTTADIHKFYWHQQEIKLEEVFWEKGYFWKKMPAEMGEENSANSLKFENSDNNKFCNV